jgi:hypothetical protein
LLAILIFGVNVSFPDAVLAEIPLDYRWRFPNPFGRLARWVKDVGIELFLMHELCPPMQRFQLICVFNILESFHLRLLRVDLNARLIKIFFEQLLLLPSFLRKMNSIDALVFPRLLA